VASLADSGRRAATRVAESLSRRRALRYRRPPRLRTGPAGGPPTVYYLCPDYDVPSGGIRAIYRHVDVLNTAGVPAAALHGRDGFACTWFEHSTRTVGASSVTLSSEDTLVVPEVYGPFLERLPRVSRLIAFSQNAYLTFEHLPAGARPLYEIFDAAMTVSEDSAEYLRFAFPGLEVSVVPNGIDPKVFHPSDETPARRIALMPRKRPAEAAEILRLLGDRLAGWDVVRIEGAGEAETAALLRSSPIFLALGHREGFGLPAAEAMASGCYVVGFPAFGGRDLFDPSFSSPIEDGDVLAAAHALAEAMERHESDPVALREAGTHAALSIRDTFSLKRQSERLLALFAA
jgi:glycosyltransferase involved in cell wall biosynthesis